MWRYAPDLDPTTPDVITSITGALIPTVRYGYRFPYSYIEKWYEATVTQTGYNGYGVCTSDAGQTRLFQCSDNTTGRIYEVTGTGTRTDRSRAGNYTAGAWFTFAQLGNTTVAGNKSDALQSSTTGAFADVTGSPPKARVVLVDANQVVLLNYNDGTDTPDGWWCSDVGTTTSWTPPTSTSPSASEARNGRLRDAGGPITAGCNSPFGGILAYKNNSFYVGTYVGGQKVREWRLISARVGCKWIEGCVNTGEQVFFAGDDIYEFDGSQARSITFDAGIQKTIRENVCSQMARVCLQFDAVNSLLYVWYGTTAAGAFNGCYVYNTKTRLWGNATGWATWTNTINTAGVTAAGTVIGPTNMTRAEFVSVFGSAGSAAGSGVRANQYCFLVNGSSVLVSFGNIGSLTSQIGGSPTTISWTCSWVGDYYRASTLKSITANLTTTENGNPAANVNFSWSVTITAKQYTPYGNTTFGPTLKFTDSGGVGGAQKFSILAKGHWFQAAYSSAALDFTGTYNIVPEWFGHTPEYQQASKA